MNYKQSIDFLTSLIDFERWIYRNYEFKLDNYLNFLRKLGNRHEKLKRVVLVAGTKGKGSTATMLSSILTAHGNKVGLYTSPHLIDYTERIGVSGIDIPARTFAGIVDELKPAILSHEPRITFFEAITTIAFYYFLDCRTTVNILEVGLGGRLDATNATAPELSVITRIGYDHMQTLGSTLTKIAREKCGILRPAKPAVVGPQRPRVRQTISTIADETGSPLIRYGLDFSADLTSQSPDGLKAHYNGANLEADFSLPLLGAHQIENAATAITAAKVLYPDIDASTIVEGLSSVKLCSRIEVIQKNPTIVVDMSHNAESAATLAETLKKLFSQHARRILLIGISRHKNRSQILKALAPFFSDIFVTEAGFARAESRSNVFKTCKRYHSNCHETVSVKDGLLRIIPVMNPCDLLVVSGSCYIAGEALEVLEAGIGTDVG